MDKQKILIADSSEAFCAALVHKLSDTYQIETAADGITAHRILQTFQPDVLVLDLVLPGLDGISLMQAAAQTGKRPKILATTCLYSEYILKVMAQFHVSYLMMKPCDLQATVLRILEMSRQLNAGFLPPFDPASIVSQMLTELGVRAKLHGYDYLRKAILVKSCDPNQSLTKEIYPTVAQQTGSTPAQVERAIRSAIATAWEFRDIQKWLQYFSNAELAHRPTNGSLISRLADRLTLLSSQNPPE